MSWRRMNGKLFMQPRKTTVDNHYFSKTLKYVIKHNKDKRCVMRGERNKKLLKFL